jgi:hypothetical protein
MHISGNIQTKETMKTSKKLLILFAGFIIILLMFSLVILRRDIGTLMEKQAFIEYRATPIDEFKSVEFSSNWTVQIRQGKDCKVELAVKEVRGLIPVLENKDEILFFTTDTQFLAENTANIRARLTAPFLNTIVAKGNTEIVMKNFWSDSLTVVLADSSTFSGKNNDFTNIIFKSYADDK